MDRERERERWTEERETFEICKCTEETIKTVLQFSLLLESEFVSVCVRAWRERERERERETLLSRVGSMSERPHTHTLSLSLSHNVLRSHSGPIHTYIHMYM